MRRDDFGPMAPGRLIQNLNGVTAYVPNPLPPDIKWNTTLVKVVTDATHALARLCGFGERFPAPQRLFRLFLKREAELSSRIEQTHASVRTVVLAEAIPEVEVGRSAVREVRNNFDVLSLVVGSSMDRPITVADLAGLNAKLFDGIETGPSVLPGQLRRAQNFIGPTRYIEDATFVPPPPLEVEPALRALCAYCSTTDHIAPVVRAALVHYQFECIHPFGDGNGRIGRALILWLLLRDRALTAPLLNPSAGLERRRRDYYDHLLAVSQKGAWEPWIGFFTTCLLEEAERSIQMLIRLERLRLDFLERARSARANPMTNHVIEDLFSNPWLNIERVVARTSLNNSTASRIIDRLVKLGIICEVTGKQRNRVYLAEDILAVFSADPPP